MPFATWLRERLGIPTRDGLSGITLALKDAWEVPATNDLARLIRACGEMPPGSVLYLEDGAHPPALQQFLGAHHAPNPMRVSRQTLWPRPSVHHVPVNAETIGYLSAYAETVAAPEVCIHLVVYRDEHVLVSAPDAPGDPVLINRHLPDEIVKAFVARLGFTREQIKTAR